MSKHVRLFPQVEEKLHRMRSRCRVGSVLASVFVLAVAALVLFMSRVLLPMEQEAAFVAYVVPEERSLQDTGSHKDLSADALDALPPVELSVEVPVAASTVPTLDAGAISSTVVAQGEGLFADGLAGVSDGFGSGMGEGGAGMGSRESAASTFCGRFWDLKKSARSTPSRYKGSESSNEVVDLLSRFFTSGWNTELFREFFESPVKLYASCFLMPICLDEEATRAYDPSGRMRLESSRWVAVYSAWVKAPASGRFRFVGIADSVMAVRFNGCNVLQCGLYNLEGGANASNFRAEADFIKYAGCRKWNEMLGGFVTGDYFEVEEGQWYRMDVLVSEIGGVGFGFCLLLDEQAAPAQVSADGLPLFQLFRTTFALPDVRAMYDNIAFPFREASGVVTVDPPFDPDSRVWQAIPIDGKRRPPAGAAEPPRRRR